MAPPSRIRWTNPFPHWCGTRTKGVIPASNAVVQSELAFSMLRVECSRSINIESKPASLASCTTAGEVTSLIPKACWLCQQGRTQRYKRYVRCIIYLHRFDGRDY